MFDMISSGNLQIDVADQISEVLDDLNIVDGSINGVSYMQMAALGVSSVSVVAKEALYHYTLRYRV
jgi:hypothetical protein